ncbi:SNARE associated Golgi family protein [Exiguobacterium sp. SH31]|uniref:TVP38/TMEM64 family protein n=1 Tax=unclassified Exiguobacterium TaxID=2644629 RepID=UPI0008AC39EA|nr:MULTISPECIES: VTT domain-containing protein [unclassified Exiguobacterium]OGX79422.1 SNARE associated Golgi family protein [Exiguobacterium sp. SH31]
MEWELLPIPLFVVISIVLNSAIAVAGVLPSAFLTALNVKVLGFGLGVTVSIVGEAVGAVISFVLYRRALQTYTSPNGKRFKRLREASGVEAWFLVLGMRLMPFVPSGLVTLSAAFSRMTLTSFAAASTIGKVPALLIEALAVTAVMRVATGWQFVLIALLVLIYLLWRVFQSNGEKI